MLHISQPFSCPGPTRMSHRKRNLSGLSCQVRKPATKLHRDTDSRLSVLFSGRGISFVFGVIALATLIFCRPPAFGRSVPTWLWA